MSNVDQMKLSRPFCPALAAEWPGINSPRDGESVLPCTDRQRATTTMAPKVHLHSGCIADALHSWLRPIDRGQFRISNFAPHFEGQCIGGICLWMNCNIKSATITSLLAFRFNFIEKQLQRQSCLLSFIFPLHLSRSRKYIWIECFAKNWKEVNFTFALSRNSVLTTRIWIQLSAETNEICNQITMIKATTIIVFVVLSTKFVDHTQIQRKIKPTQTVKLKMS